MITILNVRHSPSLYRVIFKPEYFVQPPINCILKFYFRTVEVSTIASYSYTLISTSLFDRSDVL